MLQSQTTITTINGTFTGEWVDTVEEDAEAVRTILSDHGVKALGCLDIETPTGTHYFNVDHVVAVSVTTRQV